MDDANPTGEDVRGVEANIETQSQVSDIDSMPTIKDLWELVLLPITSAKDTMGSAESMWTFPFYLLITIFGVLFIAILLGTVALVVYAIPYLLYYIFYTLAMATYYACIYPIKQFFVAIDDMSYCCTLEGKTHRVPTFYSPAIEDDSTCFVIALAIGTVFGGIHCIAWSFLFPTDTERLLWRVTAVFVAGAPLTFMAVAGFLSLTDEEHGHWTSKTLFYAFFEVVILLSYVHRSSVMPSWSSVDCVEGSATWCICGRQLGCV